ELQPDRDLAKAPLFQLMFALNPPLRDVPIWGDLRLSLISTEASTTEFDVGVYLTEYPDGIRGTVEYSTDLFEADTIDRMMRQYQALLLAALTEPDRSVDTLSFLTPDERARRTPAALQRAPGELVDD